MLCRCFCLVYFMFVMSRYAYFSLVFFGNFILYFLLRFAIYLKVISDTDGYIDFCKSNLYRANNKTFFFYSGMLWLCEIDEGRSNWFRIVIVNFILVLAWTFYLKMVNVSLYARSQYVITHSIFFMKN